jgi:hypothetical protein
LLRAPSKRKLKSQLKQKRKLFQDSEQEQLIDEMVELIPTVMKKLQLEAQWAEPVSLTFHSAFDMKLDKKQLWKVLYRDCSFRFDPLTNMAAQAILVLDWSISKNLLL